MKSIDPIIDITQKPLNLKRKYAEEWMKYFTPDNTPCTYLEDFRSRGSKVLPWMSVGQFLQAAIYGIEIEMAEDEKLLELYEKAGNIHNIITRDSYRTGMIQTLRVLGREVEGIPK